MKAAVVAHDVGNFVSVVAMNKPAGVFKTSKSPAADFAARITIGKNSKAQLPFYPIMYDDDNLVLRLCPSSKQAKKQGMDLDHVWWSTFGIADSGAKTGGRIVMRAPLRPEAAPKSLHWLDKDSRVGHEIMAPFIELCKDKLLDKLREDFPADAASYTSEWFKAQIQTDGGIYESGAGSPTPGQINVGMYAGQFTDVHMVDTSIKLTVEALCNRYLKSAFTPKDGAGSKTMNIPALICPVVRIAGFSFYQPKEGGEPRIGLRLNLLSCEIAPVTNRELFAPVFISPVRATAPLAGNKRKADQMGSVGVVYYDDDDDEDDDAGMAAPEGKKAKK